MILLILVIVYLADVLNVDPIIVGETKEVIGYVTGNNIVPHGKGATHKLEYKYTFEGRSYEDHYYSSRRISKLSPGDSLVLQVSVLQPSKNKIISYFIKKP